jgi:transcriptional regulator with XRE-family HTH domain
MQKSTSHNSAEKLNSRFKKIFTDNQHLIGNLVDARVCNNIAIDLYTLRVQSGMTQKELAEKLGIKQSNISRWEHPGYQGYKVKMLSKIVRALGGKLQIKIDRTSENMLGHINYINPGSEDLGINNWATGNHLDYCKQFIKVEASGLGVKNETF